jgi:hypothetical protein
MELGLRLHLARELQRLAHRLLHLLHFRAGHMPKYFSQHQPGNRMIVNRRVRRRHVFVNVLPAAVLGRLK